MINVNAKGEQQPVLCVLFLLCISAQLEKFVDAERLSIRMPGVTTETEEQYLCRAYQLKPDEDFYIVGYEPMMNESLVHHAIIIGCVEAASKESMWSCREMAEISPTLPMCKTGETQLIFAWAHQARNFKFPDDVGLHVNRQSGIKTLVLQVHYRTIVDRPDSSGINMLITHKPPQKIVGVVFMNSQGMMRARSKEKFDIRCDVHQKIILHPFAFRVHTHDRGVMVHGYRVRNNQWSLIGKKSPQLPQTFYPVNDSDMTITDGDTIAVRCYMENTENHDILVGPRTDNEMCTFYLLYYVDGDKILQNYVCGSKGPPKYYWEQDLKNIPKID